MTEQELKSEMEKAAKFGGVFKEFKVHEHLTKREHFAFEFAKIFLQEDTSGNTPFLQYSEWSVSFADELIKALNEEKE